MQGIISDIPGINAEGFGVIGHYVADENGQSGRGENPELVEISVLEGEVAEADARAIALPVEI